MYFFKRRRRKKGAHIATVVTQVFGMCCVSGGRVFLEGNFHFFYFVLFFSFILRAQRGVGHEEDEEAKDMKLYRTPVLSATLAPRAHRWLQQNKKTASAGTRWRNMAAAKWSNTTHP